MKKQFLTLAVLLVTTMHLSVCLAQTNEYLQRFTSLRSDIVDPANGYFSPDGVPYHSVETLICEAPDHGHETVSETYSYWFWIEAIHGKIAGDWQPLNDAWANMEANIIPTTDLQPTAGNYDPAAPATYAAEFSLPSFYPSPLDAGVPVGVDPVSGELTAAYGSEVYGMHWLLDSDNFYGYGLKGDGESTPSYINTFQRGVQESVWETIPQPSWDAFNFGGQYGYLDLFSSEDQAPSAQWKYTNAPDADARAVQVMYWAYLWAEEQGLDPVSTLPLAEASKMGDFLRLAMFDKYFKPMGAQSESTPGASGYESAHYLMSWYYAWGGPTSTSQNWAWRIGCSHNHFGYQNPVAAYALSEFDPLKPVTTNGARDWGTSLDRQLEFYRWLQSAEGGIAGGATNSWNGDYSPYPAGTPTFYDMAYVENPVYNDPGSNQWFGWQAWSMERVAEYYYIENDVRAKEILDDWVAWVKSEVNLTANGGYQIPSELSWTGAPETWNPSSPSANNNLHVSVLNYTQDVGIAGCLARALTYYAGATQKWGALDTDAQLLAKELLDRVWDNYRDDIGVSNPESRGDYNRFFEQEVFVPEGWQGLMPNGDVIEPGISFMDIRSNYVNDPDWPALEAAYNAGTDYTKSYHRFWAQADVAVANAVYGFLFGEGLNNAPNAVIDADEVAGDAPLTILFDASQSTDTDGDVLTYFWDFGDGTTSSNVSVTHTYTVSGVYTVTLEVTDGQGLSDQASLEIIVSSVGNDAPIAAFSATPTSGTEPLIVSLDASASTDPDGDVLTYSWTFGDGTADGAGVALAHTYSAAGTYVLTLVVSDGQLSDVLSTTIVVEEDQVVPGCDVSTPISLSFIQNGVGEFCWVTDDDISFINSWNMDLVEINGVDLTNTWSDNMPARIDGNYYIRYKGNFPWSHLEINGTNARMANPISQTDVKVVVHPNPATSEFFVKGLAVGATVQIMDLSGKMALNYQVKDQSGLRVSTSTFQKGIYVVRVLDAGKITSVSLIID